MPNWCHNRLSIVGPKKEVDALVAKAKGPTHNDSIEDFSFQQLVPIPDYILKLDYDPHIYNAEHIKWGVKWGGSDSSLKYNERGHAIYFFTTPWGTPNSLLQTLAHEHPKLTFVISFAEECPTRGRFVFSGSRTIDVTGKQSPMPYNDDDDDDDDNDVYNNWYYEYLNSHDEWVNNNIVNKKAFKSLIKSRDFKDLLE